MVLWQDANVAGPFFKNVFSHALQQTVKLFSFI